MQNRWTPLGKFFLKPLTPPPRDFGKNFKYPPLDFQPVCIYDYNAVGNFKIAVLKKNVTKVLKKCKKVLKQNVNAFN